MGLLKHDRPELAAQMTDSQLADKIKTQSNLRVEWQCHNHPHTWIARVQSRTVGGNGCPKCANRQCEPGFNDIATIHPEWVPEMDDRSLAETITFASSKVRQWVCHLGHQFSASPWNRHRFGTGCRECRSISITHPELAAQSVDQELPSSVSRGSARQILWRCDADANHHPWTTTPNTRTNKDSGCPSCAKYGFDPSKPAVLYVLDAQTHIVYGITGNLEQRLAAYDDSRVLIRYRDFEVGSDARALESKIKQSFMGRHYTESELPGERSESLPLGCQIELLALISEG